MTSEDWCVYCGDWYQCNDHVIPQAYNRVRHKRDKIGTVACCNQCNSLAGAIKVDSIAEKATYLADRYERKFRRILSLPSWTETELKDLTGSLRLRIVTNEYLRRLITTKLDNLNLVSCGLEVIPFNFRDFAKFTKHYHM